MRSGPPARHLKGSTARNTGRHRAPSRRGRTVAIIGVAVPAIALAGAFAAYLRLPEHPQHEATGIVADRASRAQLFGSRVADGPGTTLTTRAGGHPAGSRAAHSKPAATTRPKARQRSAPSSAPARASQPAAHPQPTQGTSSATLAAAVRHDIASGNYLLAVAHYLVGHGYSDAAAAGIASCVDGESGGNPESVGSGGGGLIGWTPLSSAAPNPNVITGNVAQDMMTQLSDLLYYNSVEIGQSQVTQLNSIGNPVSAADFFSLNFERPAITYSDVVPSVADQIFAELKA